MSFAVTIHYDNQHGFTPPMLYVEYAGSPDGFDLFAPTDADAWGSVYAVGVKRRSFHFKFKEGPGLDGRWEGSSLTRSFWPTGAASAGSFVGEIWCTAEKAFLYPALPRAAEAQSAADFLRGLGLKAGIFVPGSGGFSGLGATPLADGRVLFGFYHPNAGRVFLMGSFNDWQRPGHDDPDPAKFLELRRYRGYDGYPNTWLGVVDGVRAGDQYKFYVEGGVPSDHKNRFQQYFTDPYARLLAGDYSTNNAVVVDGASFPWQDQGWRTPDIGDAILYELSVYGFTENDPDIFPSNRGRFRGIQERIEDGYFSALGVNVLCLMPLAEVPSPQGPTSLGYEPSLFGAVERDFGAPDDLRALVDAAHRRGIAVILDVVFNHTSNAFNPLWKMVLEHPGEQGPEHEGGLYFSGSTIWGNRVATERSDVQNLLLDACKLWIAEYHVDGFRLDATHTDWMDHGFVLRLAHELKGFKPDVLLVAENIPNQADLNRDGWNGFAQWSARFHHKLKALLREGDFHGTPPDVTGIGDAFYFGKAWFASHTNNVVNYTESHDETSVASEVSSNPVLDHDGARERKGRLALFATVTALGQPMLYQGQEFNVRRGENEVAFSWPASLAEHGFFQWTSRLLHLRRRYPGLRLTGFAPAEDGRFAWVVAPWADAAHGGGRRVIGWRARPTPAMHDALVVLLNFENHAVTVDLELGAAGIWVKLADIDRIDDVPPAGSNSRHDATVLHSNDGRYGGFALPSSSGFIYKWEAG